jgi:hypothetical protein
MKLGTSRISALVAITMFALGGCASAPKGAGETPAAEVKVYRAGQLVQSQYESVRYLWADSWRTAFWLPGATTGEEGIASLQAQASRLGANGLISVVCIDQGHWSSSKEPSPLCYGHAIRVR